LLAEPFVAIYARRVFAVAATAQACAWGQSAAYGAGEVAERQTATVCQDDALGDLQSLGDFLNSEPFGLWGTAGGLQHIEEPAQVGKKLSADRAAVGMLRIPVVLVV
jgi:hypothetical protein